MLRNRMLVAAFLALSSARFEASACEVGIDPKLLMRPPAVNPYGSEPLPVMSVGTNAPEMLIHVYYASPVHLGIQRIIGYNGPCRLEAFGRFSMQVEAQKAVRPGDLFYIVSKLQPTSPHSVAQDTGWALRRASAEDESRYQSCHWS